MKLANWVLPVVLLAAVSLPIKADSSLDCKPKTEVGNLLTDVIFIRPVGAVGTLAGGVLFIALSPLTALANIPEPHNAFERVGAVLVGYPYAYTFVRPLGYFSANCY